MGKSLDNFRIRLIGYNTPEYHEALRLRYKHLRKPLGLSFDEERLKSEAFDYHLAAFTDDHLIGCLILTPLSQPQLKMRQMAVESNVQHQGVGKSLLLDAEQLAQKHGYTALILHARAHVRGFYEKMGYRVTGEYFKEVTLWHILMRKDLSVIEE